MPRQPTPRRWSGSAGNSPSLPRSTSRRRYREKGYWRDQSLAQEFAAVFDRFKERIFLVDQNRQYTYGEIDRLTDNNLFQQWDEKYGAPWAYKKETFYQSTKG